ncbi:uncharacterized protein METZ01_LOCUS281757, partial [marine metagenome]
VLAGAGTAAPGLLILSLSGAYDILAAAAGFSRRCDIEQVGWLLVGWLRCRAVAVTAAERAPGIAICLSLSP